MAAVIQELLRPTPFPPQLIYDKDFTLKANLKKKLQVRSVTPCGTQALAS